MFNDVVNNIKAELDATFKTLYAWLHTQPALIKYQPKDAGWNAQAVLEHISLTNHFLLILIRKGTAKALKAAEKEQDLETLLTGYDINWNLLRPIGDNNSFQWQRPDHMEPSGFMSLVEIEERLKDQELECLHYLDQLANGEGILYKTTMNVNGLGKLDVYHYICFLIMHAKRHIGQMNSLRTELESLN